MASRDPQELTDEMQRIFALFKDEMIKAGVDFIVTCTYRSQIEQEALWAKGRTQPGPIVTWTRASKHTERKAFDIALVVDGKITWATKDYLLPGKIAMKLGLDWGGAWARAKDYPHFQYKEPNA